MTRANGGLSRLRSGLKVLQRRRSAVRWGNAACAVVLAAGVLCLAAFVFDWSLRPTWGWRVVLLCGWFAAMAWVLRKFVWPALAVRETTTELALWVERHHAIDSDLIAALQFESAEETAWGSRQLSSAVVASVERLAPGLNVLQGFSWGDLPRRLMMVVVVLSGLSFAAAANPGECTAFWNRFWLGSARYPARTEITHFQINGQRLPAHVDQRLALNLPQGATLSIEIACAGELPASGSVRLIDHTQRTETRFDLTPAAEAPGGTLIGEHPLPSSDVQLQAFVGDNWTDPVPIRVVRLPIVSVDWHVSPPAYAAAQSPPETPVGTRQLSVLAGSAVQLSVRGANKELADVWLKLDEDLIALIPAGERAERVWQLPADSPLSHVAGPSRYEIHAIDQDGLSLTPPISGTLRLAVDYAPRVTAEITTRLVVPSAQPRLTYTAADDYGLSQVRVHFAIKRGSEEIRSGAQPVREPSGSDTLPATVREEIRLDLAPLQLQPGDELRVTVEATDARGELPAETGASEPVVLKVTDRAGVLAGLLETDQLTVKRLEQIIQRELGTPEEER